MDYIKAFITGGLICVIGQILIDKTKLTPARILVIFVMSGAFLQLFGWYEPIIRFGKCGATVPLTGFGYLLCKGVQQAIDETGIIGIFTGGITAAAGGICAALVFGFLVAVIFKSKSKA